jgi:hypothetical protein
LLQAAPCLLHVVRCTLQEKRFGFLMNVLDNVFLTIFIIELCLKLFHGFFLFCAVWKFWHRPCSASVQGMR